MEESREFSKGMYQDLPPEKLPEGMYYYALNMGLSTDEGGDKSSPTNIKGNELGITLPCVSELYSIIPDPSYFVSPINCSPGPSIEVNGITYTIQNVIGAFEIQNNTEFGKACADFLNADPTFNQDFVSTYYNERLVIHSINSSILTFTCTAGIPANCALSPQAFIVTKEAESTCPDLIGWGCIRDTVFILSTDNTTLNPGGVDMNLTPDPPSYGQVWKLEYNKQIPLDGNNSPILTLLYNNQVNFSQEYPIPNPGGIEGRYENDCTQNLYWTDSFNHLRRANIADPNLMAVPVKILDTKPAVQYSRPKLENILQGGGTCKRGLYQLLYRYSNNKGSQTAFSLPSDFVRIVKDNEESTPYAFNDPTVPLQNSYNDNTPFNPVQTSKCITWKIQDLDTNFEFIEVSVSYTQFAGSTPEILLTSLIPTQSEILYTFCGNTPSDILLTKNDINIRNTSFDTCGSISQKDNMLFAAKTKTNLLDYDYDARAYRFNHKINGPFSYVTPNFTLPDWGISETDDAINPYNYDIINNTLPLLSHKDPDAFKFQKDGLTVGGEGPNIKYSFVTRSIKADIRQSYNQFSTNFYDYTTTNIPYKNVPREITALSLNSDIYLNKPNTFSDFNSPYLDYPLKGWKRNETYRISITFFDLSLTPSAAKWIADIRMPDVHEDPDDPTAYYGLGEFQNSGNSFFTKQLYPKFTVNIPEDLSKLISGYSISAVPIDTNNRTILAQGLIYNVFDHFPSPGSPITLYIPNDIAHNNTGQPTEYFRSDYCFYQAPEFQINGYDGLQTGDMLILINELHPVDGKTPGGFGVSTREGTGLNEPDNDHFYGKLYADRSWNLVANPNSLNTERSFKLIDYVDLPRSTKGVVHNFVNFGGSINNISEVGGLAKTMGVKCQAFNIIGSNGGSFAGVFLAPDEASKILADYYRPRPNQYGGNTYTARANNIYTFNSHFQKVQQNQGNQVIESIPPGDTWTQVWDMIRSLKLDSQGVLNGEYGTGFYFPTESRINGELRGSKTMNNAGFSDTFKVDSASNDENYIYDPLWSTKNNLYSFFPKPIQIQDCDLIEQHDNRIYASQVKIDGENTDNWSIFKTNDFIDVDGSYGEITNLIRNGNKIVFFQPRGIGVPSINDRSIIQDDSGQQISLGTGGVLTRVDYISTEAGSSHQFGFTSTDKGIYFFDSRTSTQYVLSDTLVPLSIKKGMSGFLKNNISGNLKTSDNPYLKKGISSTYDHSRKEVYFTFLDYYDTDTDPPIRFTNNFTLVYNEEENCYTDFRSYTPSVYINDTYNIITPDDINSSLYFHNFGFYGKFYGELQPSKITLISNKGSQDTKIFLNQELITSSISNNTTNIQQYPPLLNQQNNINNVFNPDVQQDTFDLVRYYNHYQNTDFQALQPISNRTERKWCIQIPRNRVIQSQPTLNIFDPVNLTSPSNKPFGEKMRDTILFTDLIYLNNNDYKLSLQSVKTLFNPSYH